MWIAYGASAIALVVALAAVLFSGNSPSGATANSGAALNSAVSGLHTSAAVTSMLELSPLSASGQAMPEFRLTDQRGNPMSLAEFRGRAVVLTFNDDRCQDLCTLLAESVVAADHDLGTHQNRVAFVSINANSYYPRVSDVAAWTDSHGLGKTANWYFGTGTAKQLSDASDAYEVPVTRDAKTKTIEHGAEVFYIDPEGHEVGIGGFGNTSADTEIYGHDMAQLAMSLLPRSERSAVGGTSGPPATVSGGLGSSPAPVSVPALMTSGSVSTAADPKHYTVLNFWSSSCTACITELPGFEAVHAMYGNAVDFLGIDVADNAALGRKLGATTGIDYPVGNDATGRVSGSFQVADLPFTVVLDPNGKVVIRHPGLFTEEQLAYVLEDLEPSLQKLDTLDG